MSSRLRGLATAALILGLAGQASAQIQSSGLDDLDEWGVNLLHPGEAPLDPRLWSGSDGEFVIALMERIDVAALSPGEHALLSHALRSPADEPGGDMAGTVQAERIRLLVALGERQAAATLSRQAAQLPEGFDPDAVLSDARLAEGELKVVCAQMNQTGEGRFWSELRAVCTLAAQDLASAELAIEIAAQQEGAEEWFTETAIAVLADSEDRPAARYGSGLDIAFSELAGLEPDEESLSAERPDLAAMIALDGSRPLALRIAAANLAAPAGEIDAADHRALYTDLTSAADFEPANAIEAAFVVMAKQPEPVEPDPVPIAAAPDGPRDLRSMTEDWIEPVQPEDLSPDALEAEMVDEISLAEEQSLALAEALRSARGDAEVFAATARLFEQDLETLPVEKDTAENALLFATAALAAGNAGLAGNWLDRPVSDDLTDRERFRGALLEGYGLVLADRRRSGDLSDLAVALLDSAIEPADQQAAYRLFSVWSGFDMPVPVEARMALATAELKSRRIDAGMLAAVESGERNGAAGEALLLILTQTEGAPDELSGTDLATILRTLRRMKANDEAWLLAAEAAGLW